jgi:hypothetical protein
MKKVLTILGYLTTLFLLSTIAFKVNRYTGEEIVMAITGLLISSYFPIYILEYGKTTNSGKAVAVNYALAITVFLVGLGATLKLSHLELGSLIILVGFGSFCLIYSPLLFIKKSKETGSNKLMYLAGVTGLASFPVGIFLRVYLGSAYGIQMFSIGAILISLIFLPIYLLDKSLSNEERQKRATTTFYALIIGFLLFFCLFKSVYPPKIENQTHQTNQPANVEH